MMGKTQNVWAKCMKFWISCVCAPRPVHAYYLHPHVTYFDIMIYYVMALVCFGGGGGVHHALEDTNGEDPKFFTWEKQN